MKNNMAMLGMIIVCGGTFIPWIYIRAMWEQGPAEGPLPTWLFVPTMIALEISVGIINLMLVDPTIKFISTVMKARYRRTFKK